MNLSEEWRRSDQADEELSALIKKGVPKGRSKDPIETIKRNLLANSFLGLLTCAGYGALLYHFPVWQILVCIGIVLAFTLWATVKTLLFYARIQQTFRQASLLEQLERAYALTQKWMKVQQQVGLLIYPASAAGGFMVGGSLGAEKPVGEVMNEPVMIVALLLAILVLVPICFYLARWLCKKGFGQYAEQLKQTIRLLKQE